MFVEHGQRSWKAEAYGANIAVRFLSKAGSTGAEHFTVRLDLAVDFEADSDDII